MLNVLILFLQKEWPFFNQLATLSKLLTSLTKFHKVVVSVNCSPALSQRAMTFSLGNSAQFKITFVIAHRIADRILQIIKCDRIAIRLYSLATNLNTDKPIEQFKITFIIAHRIAERILRIVKCDRIAFRLYSLATNLNTDKPIEQFKITFVIAHRIADQILQIV